MTARNGLAQGNQQIGEQLAGALEFITGPWFFLPHSYPILNKRSSNFVYLQDGVNNNHLMIQELQHFYLRQDEPNKSCLLALRTIILQQDPGVTETLKYGMPCFCYRKKMFCYLWTDKKTSEPYLLMVEGNHLHHPKLEAGSRSRMKIFRVNPNRNLPAKTLTGILQTALDLYKKGIIKVGS